MRTLTLCLAAALVLAGCNSVQTTSGADYLARYDAALAAQPANSFASSGASGTDVAVTDAAIRQAAAVEPILTFPARFGLARIENGQLTGIPVRESALWTALIEKHDSLGEFVVISPLIAEAASHAVGQPRAVFRRPTPGELVATIRIGAARQHVDAVLIYEVGATSRKDRTAFSFFDITVIGGAFLPTRSLEAQGVASALLMDVRNGYPYGTASAVSDLSELYVSYGSSRRRDKLRDEAALMGVANLVPEVDAMLGKLVVEMAKRDLPAS